MVSELVALTALKSISPRAILESLLALLLVAACLVILCLSLALKAERADHRADQTASAREITVLEMRLANLDQALAEIKITTKSQRNNVAVAHAAAVKFRDQAHGAAAKTMRQPVSPTPAEALKWGGDQARTLAASWEK